MTPSITPEARKRCGAIMNRIPGYSGIVHYCFFQWLLRHESITDFLVLGVYHGRDIAFIQDILKHEHPNRVVPITGVDRFACGPCADWPKDKLTMTWEEAGMGKAPSYEAAIKNCPGATIIKAHDEDFLKATEDKWSCVYLDTSHDEETVARQLKQMPKVCRKGAIIAGDDYSDAGTWGVVTAVKNGTTQHEVFCDYLWHTRVENLKGLK